MYLDMILVPYFRLSSIFLYFLYFTHSFIFTKFRFRPTTVRRTPTTHTARTSTFTHALLTTLFLLHILIPSFLGIFSLLSCFRTWQLVGSYSGDLLDVHITPRRDGLADYPPHPYHTRSRARHRRATQHILVVDGDNLPSHPQPRTARAAKSQRVLRRRLSRVAAYASFGICIYK